MCVGLGAFRVCGAQVRVWVLRSRVGLGGFRVGLGGSEVVGRV